MKELLMSASACLQKMKVPPSLLVQMIFLQNTLQIRLPVFIPAGGSVKINMEMIEIQTEEEYNSEKEAFLSWIEDFGDYEKVILKQFIAAEELHVNPLPSGIYYLNLTPGTGKKVELGDTVTVNYEGRFLNGKFFDSTSKTPATFSVCIWNRMAGD